MDKIADKLSEIEMTARAIVENAENQKHLLEQEMQDKRNQFDEESDAATQEKLNTIRSELQQNMEHLLNQQRKQNEKELLFLKEDFEKNHTKYAEEILSRITEVSL